MWRSTKQVQAVSPVSEILDFALGEKPQLQSDSSLDYEYYRLLAVQFQAAKNAAWWKFYCDELELGAERIHKDWLDGKIDDKSARAIQVALRSLPNMDELIAKRLQIAEMQMQNERDAKALKSRSNEPFESR